MIKKGVDENGNIKYIITGKEAEVISEIESMNEIQKENLFKMIKLLNQAWFAGDGVDNERENEE